MTLQAIIGTVAEFSYFFSGARAAGMDFFEAVIRGWIPIIIISRIIVSFATLGCIIILYFLSRKFNLPKAFSLTACAFYATSYPVLMYINRLAPEPLTMLYSLLALLCAWQTVSKRGTSLIIWSAAAGIATSAACFEKFYQGILLFPVIFIFFIIEENN